MTTKKMFVELVDFLEANKTKKVSAILEEVKQMTQQKTQLKTVIFDENKNVVAVFCYYHKQFELVNDVPYGKKASSTSGLNTMCKVGVSKWTKQNRRIKDVNQKVLELLETGEIKSDQIGDYKEKLIEEAKTMDTEDMPTGYLTVEELNEVLETK